VSLSSNFLLYKSTASLHQNLVQTVDCGNSDCILVTLLLLFLFFSIFDFGEGAFQTVIQQKLLFASSYDPRFNKSVMTGAKNVADVAFFGWTSLVKLSFKFLQHFACYLRYLSYHVHCEA